MFETIELEQSWLFQNGQFSMALAFRIFIHIFVDSRFAWEKVVIDI